MRGTFCDELINMGYEFHSDTVVFDIGSCYKSLEAARYHYHLQSHTSLPPFDYMFFEMTNEYGIRSGMYVSKTDDYLSNHESAYGYRDPLHFLNVPDKSFNILSFVKKTKAGQKANVQGRGALFFQGDAWIPCYEKDGYGVFDDFGVHGTTESLNVYDLPHYKFKEEDFNDFGANVLNALIHLHQKADIELVDYPRNYRRRIKRQTGKEPSPYFLLKVGNETRKQSASVEYTNIGSKSKAPLHIVRGHFRHVENHPIEHFNGTFWIPAHTRGDKANGEIKKGYTIRLPESA